jgi:hypothetical protein
MGIDVDYSQHCAHTLIPEPAESGTDKENRTMPKNNMTFQYELDHPRDNRKVPASAFEAARDAFNRLNADINALFESRFMKKIAVERNDGCGGVGRKLWPCLVSEISAHYDMADCYVDDDTAYFYVEDDGTLHPVTVGGKQTNDPDPDGDVTNAFVYATSDLIANGKVVGSVMHTDH